MTQFDNRREAAEAHYALEETLRFKATARRNRLLGLWAADRLGQSGPDAEHYAGSVVRADFEEAGDGDVLGKVARDLAAAGLDIPEATIRAKMDELLLVARAELAAGR